MLLCIKTTLGANTACENVFHLWIQFLSKSSFFFLHYCKLLQTHVKGNTEMRYHWFEFVSHKVYKVETIWTLIYWGLEWCANIGALLTAQLFSALKQSMSLCQSYSSRKLQSLGISSEVYSLYAIRYMGLKYCPEWIFLLITLFCQYCLEITWMCRISQLYCVHVEIYFLWLCFVKCGWFFQWLFLMV